MTLLKILPLIIAFVFSSISFAEEADVLNVEVKKMSKGTYQFSVTVSHKDEGWNHYADKWDIAAPDGTILATRTLHHPHVDEQPFTRSLSGVKISSKIKKVTVRANDSVHGFGGKTISVTLPQ
ncbi:MAG: hypothetical protein JRJ76_14675 [Deltaproteobacteria bacterium]|nr:hypothetical protein [Deltaproteobacteria bacterium]MBW2181703.1 hypothetical protein [Deltaproteobacteria bacterium]